MVVVVLVIRQGYSIPYESSKDVKRQKCKEKMASGPQYVDINISKSMADYNNYAIDENYYGSSSVDNKDEDGDETIDETDEKILMILINMNI